MSLTIVFTAGLLSFLSPCILPLIPSYLGYLSGLTLTNGYRELKTPHLRAKLFLDSLFFALGFSVIFISLGAVASLLGEFLAAHKLIFQRIGGVVIIIFGLHLTGLFKLSFLYKEKRFRVPQSFNKLGGKLRSFLVGVIFAFGWVACIGPILASILVLASIFTTLSQGVLLLTVYSLGLAIPFLLTGLFIAQTSIWLKRFSRFIRFVPIISGGLLIILGVLFLTNDFIKVVGWLYQLYNNLGIPLL